MRTDVLGEVYDMDMQVTQVAGRYVALYFDGEDEAAAPDVAVVSA